MDKNLKLIHMNAVEAEEIKWLWYPYIPYGKITVIQGDPGDGLGDTVKPRLMKKLKPLAVEGVKSRGIIAELKKRVTGLLKQIGELKKALAKYESKGSILEELNYHNAQRRAPRRMAAVIAEIMRSPAERTEQQHKTPERKRGHGMEL